MAVNTDKMYLSEIGEQDKLMHADVLKKCRDIKLDNREESHVLINELFGVAVHKLGATDANTDMTGDELRATMNRHGIKDELDDGEGKEDFSAGVYLYKDGDLAYFISRPMKVIPSVVAINQTPHYLVRTNVSP